MHYPTYNDSPQVAARNFTRGFYEGEILEIALSGIHIETMKASLVIDSISNPGLPGSFGVPVHFRDAGHQALYLS